MTVFSGTLADAYAAWLDSLASCYATITPCLNRRKPSRQIREKEEFLVYRDQPGFTPPPTFNTLASTVARDEAPPGERRPASSRRPTRSFSVTKRFWSHGSSLSRRPKISAPSNFRHIHSESFQFPPSNTGSSRPAPRRPRSFRPLELSIYVENNLSPILPHFVPGQDNVSPPEPAHTHNSSFDSNGSTLAHRRSLSSVSFHFPRRAVAQLSATATSQDVEGLVTPPRIPPRSRARAYTSPDRVDRMVERVASAMLERDKLQAEIDSIVERQSIYMGSRPTTANDMQDFEPMPSIPALPAAGPSFAERLSVERLSVERPRMAPPRAFVQSSGIGSTIYELPDVFDIPQAPTQQPRQVARQSGSMPPERQLAPPLPLVLRPPLRKKKSFSRVSNWLFPADGSPSERPHRRDLSFDSVTNAPLPVTDRDGFYTCMAPARRDSFDTLSSAYSWDTQTEERTQPTTMSITDSPVGKQLQDTRNTTPTPTRSTQVSRSSTFGRLAVDDSRHRPQSVGVAF